jgi:phenylalanyl-tRNA synthetase beta chain
MRNWNLLPGGPRPLGPAGQAVGLAGVHPTRRARVLASGRSLGAVGEVDPQVLAAHDIDGRVGWFQVDLGALLESPREPLMYRPVSRFPSADIDLAFVVDEPVPAADVERTLARAAGDYLERIQLFDVFRGPQLEGARSLAWRLRFSSLDHTLGEEELTDLRRRCIDAVTSAHPARLRG